MGTTWEEIKFVDTCGNVVLLGTLALGAYQDWKEQQIHILLPVAAGLLGVFLWLVRPQFTLEELVGGIGIGLVLLLTAWLSHGQVGAGDGAMIILCGIFLGFWKNMELFFTALMFVALAALGLIVIKKKRRDYRMPFLPFVLAAYLVQLMGGV